MTSTIQTQTTRSSGTPAEPARGALARSGATDAPGRTFGATLDGLLTLDRAFGPSRDLSETTSEPDTADASHEDGSAAAADEADQTEEDATSEQESSSGDNEGDSEQATAEDAGAAQDGSSPDGREPSEASESGEVTNNAEAPRADAADGEPVRTVTSESDVTRELSTAADVDLDELASEELRQQTQGEPAVGGEPEPVVRDRSAPRERVPAERTNADQRPASPSQGHAKPDATTKTPEQAMPTPVVREASLAAASVVGARAEGAAAARAAAAVPQTANQQGTPGAGSRGAAAGSVVTIPGTPVVSGSGSANSGGAGMDLGAQPQQQLHTMLGTERSGEKLDALRRGVLTQVERGLGSVLKTNGGSLRIRLNPDHLGEVQIRLEMKDGTVSARITAETPGAQRLLEEGAAQLRTALEAKGVRVDQLVIEGPDEQAARFGMGNPGADGERGGDFGGRGGRGSRHGGDGTGDGDGQDGGFEDGDDTERGIWTELGLDAIA